uniref:Uncharacterized protein n=1 Tax=Panagrolaimus sp. ES5 TaxID=591445 RepID=A0AC34F946_9BILA
MVRIAVCYPNCSKAITFKDGKEKSFNLSLGLYKSNIPYRPWEASYKDVIEYLEVIHSKSSQPFDYLIVILDNDFNNAFRKIFIEIAASWKFKDVQIIDSFHLSLFGSVYALKISPNQNDILWEISLFRDHIRCKIWTYNLEDGWHFSRVVSHEYEGETPSNLDLHELRLKLGIFNQSNIPYIMLHHFGKEQKQDFEQMFPFSKNPTFPNSLSDKKPCKMALKYGRGLCGELRYLQYRCQPILNRIIEVKTENVEIVEMGRFETLPSTKISSIDPEQKNVLEVNFIS